MVSSGVTGIELAQLPSPGRAPSGKTGGAALCIQAHSALGPSHPRRAPSLALNLGKEGHLAILMRGCAAVHQGD